MVITLEDRLIGAGQPCFIIAEAGVNHNGDPVLAHRLIDVAKAAGADAVKFQTFKADQLVTLDAPKAEYQLQQTEAGETQYAMLKRLELSAGTFHDLQQHCHAVCIRFMSTPFDEDSADLLSELGVTVFKTPSGEITNLPYLAHVARKERPMIVSTGMATLGEVEMAVSTIRAAGNQAIVLLQCVSNYPADPADVNLRAMETMARAFGVPVGFSDHTAGIEVALAAVALGACVIEKHFTLDRTMPGPDHAASLEPDQLAAMIRGIRNVEAALGHGRKEPAARELNTAEVARKSLVAAHDLKAGMVLSAGELAVKRPGTGLPPAMRSYVIGRTLRVDVRAGTLIGLEMLA
ncbi:MAG: N-acetylneuraminate synthase [Thermoflexales bacterium]|nr:N-acetylneuraminate synthase [Thermoflexales bacterium]